MISVYKLATNSLRITLKRNMKLHEFAHALFRFEHDPPSLSLSCKRLRSDPDTSSFDLLKAFVLPENTISPSNPTSSDARPHVETGGTRWNPTQEQIEMLEMVYRGGMRTPNAQQIEKIASKLAKYGKIQGKNVFYWFQNHKARERQKLKRVGLGLALSPTITLDMNMVEENSYKRKSRSWGLEWFEEDRRLCKDGTLELFPLHPQG